MKKKAAKQAEIENQRMNEEIQLDVQRQKAIDEIMAQEICDGHRDNWAGFTGLDIHTD